MRLRRLTSGTLWLPEHLRDALVLQGVDNAPYETGGILLGYELVDELAVVVTDLVGPGPTASYSRGEFVPDGLWQEHQVARIYERSGRRTTYLGDWHSHPDGSPTPSRRDHRTARAIGRHAPARMPRPVMLIAASGDEKWLVAAFRLRRRKLRPIKIKLYPKDVRALSRSDVRQSD
jgi:integrative and conjugative element protein (TIGR02256 family)